MHPYLDLPYWQETIFSCEERMLLIGMDDLVCARCWTSMSSWYDRGERQIDQVVVGVNPDMQDRLELHFVCLGIVSPGLVPCLHLADRLLPVVGSHHRPGAEATGAFSEPQRTCIIRRFVIDPLSVMETTGDRCTARKWGDRR